MNAEDARTTVENRFQTLVADTPEFHRAHFLVHSPSRDVHWPMAAGGTEDDPAHPDQPYHAASVGKLFTATLIELLAEGRDLEVDDPIVEYLPADLLEGLHVYRGTDYTGDIEIRHLLGHTSGLPHLFPDEFGILNRRREVDAEGRTYFDVMLEEPDRFIAPEETIEWAKANLHPHFPPGKGIHYSEVGYNLLGLIVESVTGRPYHEVLHERLFDPLGMEHSSLLQFSSPATESPHPVSSVWVDDREFAVEDYRSFSGWYAGGQTVNTTADLLAFHRALVAGELVSPETLASMQQWRRLSIGLDYGYGMARLRPLPLMERYRCWGGIGTTNSVSFYNPGHDVYLIGTFNQTARRSRAYRFVFRTLRTVSKVATEATVPPAESA